VKERILGMRQRVEVEEKKKNQDLIDQLKQ
jgi:hypothetical protein